MAKWIAVKRKEWQVLRERAEAASEIAVLNDAIEELKRRLAKAYHDFNCLSQHPDNVSYVSNETYDYLCEQAGITDGSSLVEGVLRLKADAALGALVRQMPMDSELKRHSDGDFVYNRLILSANPGSNKAEKPEDVLNMAYELERAAIAECGR